MTMGQKIKRFRTIRGFTQKELASMCMMSESAIRNYELGNRKPSKKRVEVIAQALQISVYTLSDPDLDHPDSLAQVFFYLEDQYNVQVEDKDGEKCLSFGHVDVFKNFFSDFLEKWYYVKEKLEKEEITKAEYDFWRHSYPFDTLLRQKGQEMINLGYNRAYKEKR